MVQRMDFDAECKAILDPFTMTSYKPGHHHACLEETTG